MKRCFEAPGNVIGRGINPAAIQGMLVQSLHFETPGLLRSARNDAVPGRDREAALGAVAIRELCTSLAFAAAGLLRTKPRPVHWSSRCFAKRIPMTERAAFGYGWIQAMAFGKRSRTNSDAPQLKRERAFFLKEFN